MKYTNLLAALALLAGMSGTRAQAQQEVDPTNYPLTPTVAHAAKQPASHTVKGSQTQNPQHHATIKKTQKSATSSAHHATIKTVSKR